MCWYSKEKKAAQIAREDIRVYKIMLRNPDTGRLRSLYYGMKYEVRKVYSTYIKPINFDPSCTKYRMEIDKGFHSYSADETEIIKDIYWRINSKKVKNNCLEIILHFDLLDDEYKKRRCRGMHHPKRRILL